MKTSQSLKYKKIISEDFKIYAEKCANFKKKIYSEQNNVLKMIREEYDDIF